MYLRGRLSIDLTETSVVLSPPRSLFAGLANVLSSGHWQTREELEQYQLLVFAQAAGEALAELGVDDIVRVSVGSVVVSEDTSDAAGDLAAALRRLDEHLAAEEPDPHAELVMIFKHVDDSLVSVIDLGFVREHDPGVDPVVIDVTSTPAELRRADDEDLAAYRARIAPTFTSQDDLDVARAAWESHFDTLLDRLADALRRHLRVEDVEIETRAMLPRDRDEHGLGQATRFGQPLYGFNLASDLAYLLLWDALWNAYGFRVYDAYYEVGTDLADVYIEGWDLEDERDFATGGVAQGSSNGSDGSWSASDADRSGGDDSGGSGGYDSGGDSGDSGGSDGGGDSGGD